MGLSDRIAALEVEVRRLRGILATSALLLVALLVAGWAGEGAVLELTGRSLKLVDAEGRPYLTAEPVEGGGVLQLTCNSMGAIPPAVRLECSTRGRAVSLQNNLGVPEIFLSDPEGGRARVGVFDRNARLMGMLLVHPNGHGGVVLLDAAGKSVGLLPEAMRYPVEATGAEKVAEDQCKAYLEEAMAWMGKNGFDPPSSLEAVVGPVKLDPWGRPYKFYEVNATVYVMSSGPDGKDGTLDDISIELITRSR